VHGSAANMALDEALLRADPILPTLRTYAWDPWTLSLGYFQVAEEEKLAAVQNEGFGVVRRPTGGGAIFHGLELTYAVVCPLDEPGFPHEVEGAYDVVHGIIADALDPLGVRTDLRGHRDLRSDSGAPDEFWCFYHSTPFDLVQDDRKLVGSAQRRTGRGFLMHGSIPLAENPFTPEAAYADVSYGDLEQAMAVAVENTLHVNVSAASPSREERRMARHLARERYAAEEWLLRR
jgi:lipoate-protein ligase A